MVSVTSNRQEELSTLKSLPRLTQEMYCVYTLYNMPIYVYTIYQLVVNTHIQILLIQNVHERTPIGHATVPSLVLNTRHVQWLRLFSIFIGWECLSRHWVGIIQALGIDVEDKLSELSYQ